MSVVEPMRANPAHALRFGIDCLRLDTREVLLDAIGTETIIAGAYTDSGSICPSVAVHRRGAEGSLNGFARAWDEFTGAVPGRPRVATTHELRVLREMLEASIAHEEANRELLTRTLAGVASSGRSALRRPRSSRIGDGDRASNGDRAGNGAAADAPARSGNGAVGGDREVGPSLPQK